MPFFADAMNDGTYILVEFEGNLTRGELDAGRLSAQKLLETHDCGKLLMDFTAMSRQISTADIYIFVASLKIFLAGVKVALVIPPEQKWCAGFAEHLASNRGICLKVSTDHGTAKSWLLSHVQVG
jgi:hypothetical protein